jgi:hypothetical protein
MPEHPILTAAKNELLFQLEAIIDRKVLDAMHDVRLRRAPLNSLAYAELLSVHLQARAIIAEREEQRAARVAPELPSKSAFPAEPPSVRMAGRADLSPEQRASLAALTPPRILPGASKPGPREKTVLVMPGRTAVVGSCTCGPCARGRGEPCRQVQSAGRRWDCTCGATNIAANAECHACLEPRERCEERDSIGA